MGRNETQAESYAHVTYPHMLCSLFVDLFLHLLVCLLCYFMIWLVVFVCSCVCVVCLPVLFALPVCLSVRSLVDWFGCLIVWLFI